MDKTITALDKQKNNSERLNVFLDGEFAFGVSQFVGAWLKIGQKIDETKTRQLLASDEKERAYQSALKYIGYKQRTQKEVTKKLSDLSYSIETVELVLNELIEKKYINDRDYATQWIELRADSKPRSKRMMQLELRQKGIDDEVITSALNDAPDDLKLAIKLGTKYLKRFAALNHSDLRKKLTGILSRRAFSFSEINEALDRLVEMQQEKN